MSESGKVLNAFVNSLPIVDDESAHEGARRSGIYEDHRDIARAEFLQQRLLDAKGHDSDSLDVPLEHAADAGVHALEVVVGGADENFVAVGHGNFFEAFDQLGEEWVGDLGNEQAEKTSAPRDEGAGLCVGKVVQFADGFPDALSEL